LAEKAKNRRMADENESEQREREAAEKAKLIEGLRKKIQDLELEYDRFVKDAERTWGKKRDRTEEEDMWGKVCELKQERVRLSNPNIDYYHIRTYITLDSTPFIGEALQPEHRLLPYTDIYNPRFYSLYR